MQWQADALTDVRVGMVLEYDNADIMVELLVLVKVGMIIDPHTAIVDVSRALPQAQDNPCCMRVTQSYEPLAAFSASRTQYGCRPKCMK